MLALRRQLNQEIVINGNIRVTIKEIRAGSSVLLGISAPKDVVVHRGEVQAEIESWERVLTHPVSEE